MSESTMRDLALSKALRSGHATVGDDGVVSDAYGAVAVCGSREEGEAMVAVVRQSILDAEAAARHRRGR